MFLYLVNLPTDPIVELVKLTKAERGQTRLSLVTAPFHRHRAVLEAALYMPDKARHTVTQAYDRGHSALMAFLLANRSY